MCIFQRINSISEEEKTPISLNLVDTIQIQTEQILALKDEIARLKVVKPKSKIKLTISQYLKRSIPQILASRGRTRILQKKTGNRPDSAKRKKTRGLEIHDTKIRQPDEIPED